MVPRLLALAVIATIAAVGCADSGSTRFPSLRPSSITPIPTETHANVAAERLPACRLSSLAVSVEQYAAGGFGVRVANRGPACRLLGAAYVQGFDRRGQRIAVMRDPSPPDGIFALRPHRTGVSWMTIDVDHTSCQTKLAMMRVRLHAAGRSVRIPGNRVARPSAEDPLCRQVGPMWSARRDGSARPRSLVPTRNRRASHECRSSTRRG